MAGKSWRTSGHQFFVGFFFALPEGINSKTCKNMTSYRKMSGWKCDKCAPVLHSYTLFLRLKKGQGEIFESRSLIMSRQKSLSQLQPKLSGTFLDIRDGPWYSQMYGLFFKEGANHPPRFFAKFTGGYGPVRKTPHRHGSRHPWRGACQCRPCSPCEGLTRCEVCWMKWVDYTIWHDNR